MKQTFANIGMVFLEKSQYISDEGKKQHELKGRSTDTFQVP